MSLMPRTRHAVPTGCLMTPEVARLLRALNLNQTATMPLVKIAQYGEKESWHADSEGWDFEIPRYDGDPSLPTPIVSG